MPKRPYSNKLLWRLRHDWVTYKVPISEGKVLIPQDFLEPDFEFNPIEYWYSYEHNRRDRRKIADFAGMDDAWFFVNQRAYEAFKDMFTRHGKAYSVRCNNEPHYIVLIDTMHDAIDMKRSKFERSEIEEKLEDDISQVKKVVLRDGFSTVDDIFRIDRGFALSLVIIVSDAFKTRYERSGLTGLFFMPTDGSDSEKS
jgi:hypothetical protein